MFFRLFYFMFFPLVRTQSDITYCLWLLSLQQSLCSLFCGTQEMMHSTVTFYFHSLVTLANLPPLGLTNAVAEGMRSEENIYTIEENVYEMEDPSEYYCYASPGQQSWQPPRVTVLCRRTQLYFCACFVFSENYQMCQLIGFKVLSMAPEHCFSISEDN